MRLRDYIPVSRAELTRSIARAVDAAVREEIRVLLPEAAAQYAAQATTGIRDQVLELNRKTDQLGIRMSELEDQQNEELGALIALVVAESLQDKENIRALTDALNAAQEALGDADAETKRQVQAALDADALQDAARTQAYIEQLKAAAPSQPPEVMTPDPGQPAEPPLNSGIDIPDVSDEGSDEL